MLLILRFMFTFSLLKKFTKEKLYGASHSFCDTILQEKGALFFFFFFNQLLLQSILGPLRDAACSFPRWRGGLLLMLLFGVFSTKLKECSCLIALLMSLGPSPGELLEVYERVPAS